MKSTQKNIPKSIPLSKIVTVLPKSYPSTNIEYDNITILNNYLPGASTLDVIERFSASLAGAKSGHTLSITGPYGSGKSTTALFMSGLLSGKKDTEWLESYKILKNKSSHTAKILVDAREKSNINEKGLIKCIVTARREPITVTILRALDYGAHKYFGNYTRNDFLQAPMLHRIIKELESNEIPSTNKVIDIIKSMCESAPVLIMIDEFGKNIEYFTTDETQQSDLFLLQELAEISGSTRSLPLSIITFQHMAFEEYAIGATITQRREWSKIQGRFEDIPFANSPDQTRLLISNTIQRTKKFKNDVIIRNWAKKESKHMQSLGIDSGFDFNMIASCYPLGPLAVEVLPELCSRYGQHERTLLSFISDASRYTVATFIHDNSCTNNILPAIGLDTLYDYFISGTSMIHSSSANITRLMEIETIIRDSHGLSDIEAKMLKTIGILNLIGRSGYLRASRRVLEYSIGINIRSALKKLEEKSIITYRKYTDEYRIWHGTDIDIASKLSIYRKRHKESSLSYMLQNVMNLAPIVAAKHSIQTGTMRLFDRQFTTDQYIKLDEKYDGVIIYQTDNFIEYKCDRPVIIVKPDNTSILRDAVIEVIIIRDMLTNDNDITSDWVVKNELNERLADAEIILYKTFDDVYGDGARWEYEKNNKQVKQHGTPSLIVSKICDDVYTNTPNIYNEMINKNTLSVQGSSARRKLLESMIMHTSEPNFSIKGYGPERAVYEAIFNENNIHVKDKGNKWKLQDPINNALTPVWHIILDKIKNSDKRVVLSDIYKKCKQVPTGMKEGPILILVVAIFVMYKNNIALYEHGTYTPSLLPEIAERMAKNPEFFEFKYFKSTIGKKLLLETVINKLKINSKGSILDVVGHLVRIVSTLEPYTKNTKKLDKNTLAVRDAILKAIEPDTLLFESLPKGLGYESKMSETDMINFSKNLAKSTNRLQNEFTKMLYDIQKLLYDKTGIDDRKKLSKIASVMINNASDQKLKAFLGAVAADTLEKNEDWIKYIAMSLTDIPPDNWNDDQRKMFENNLIIISNKFKMLASIYFSNISDSFPKSAYQITITRTDGHQQHNIVSYAPEKKKSMEKIATRTIQEIEKNGSIKDVDAFIAILCEKYARSVKPIKS